MKSRTAFRLISVLILAIISINTFSQSSDYGINYQAVARDTEGNPLEKQSLTITLEITDPAGTVLWQEIHDVITSSLGLFSLIIGNDIENRSGGDLKSFYEINWQEGPMSLGVTVKNGDETITLDKTSIEAVPVALYGRDEDADATNELQGLRLNNGQLSLTETPEQNSVDLNSYLSDQVGWQRDADTVFYLDGNVGVGTVSPGGILEVQSKVAGDEPIFQVVNNEGTSVFAVYNEGVEITIPETSAKGAKSGFAVGGYNSGNKLLPADEYFFQIKPEGANINFLTDDASKGLKSGFAVGGYNTTKTDPSSYIYMDPYAVPFTYDDGLYIPIFETLYPKGNCYLGTMAGQLRKGQFNTSVGYQSGYSLSAGIISTPIFVFSAAKYNTNVGAFSGFSNIYGDYNVNLGYQSGYTNTSSSNIFIGYRAGYNNNGSGNIFIGTNAGYNDTGSNLLIVDNSNTTTPLIWGNFDTNRLKVSGNMAVNYSALSGYGLIVDTPSDQTETYALYVRGNAYAYNGTWLSSDENLKKNILTISDPVKKLVQLNGVSFEWNESNSKSFDSDRHLGLIAQDVENVFPELIKKDMEGYLAVNYTGLIPVLVEAVKDQQTQINELNKKNAALESENEILHKELEEIKTLINQLMQK